MTESMTKRDSHTQPRAGSTANRRRLSRRSLLAVPAAATIAAVVSGSRAAFSQAPAFVRTGRPTLPSGVMAGDVTADSAVIWSRTDRPARMWVEWSTSESFADARLVRGPLALPGGDFTARVELTGLPAGQDVVYRVTFEDIGDGEHVSEPLSGHVRTAPGAVRRDIVFAWSGDTAGQGWGIWPEWGGMRIYETMRRLQPDFFVHSGDNIYADGPIRPEVPLPEEITLPSGRTTRTWQNLLIPGIEKVAETLDEYRARYRYNLLDENLRRFYADTSLWAQWDDHEVTNNWWPGQVLPEARAFASGYSERRLGVLSAHATAAFFDYQPVRINPAEPHRVYRSVRYGPDLELFILDERTYRAANSSNKQPSAGPDTEFLGRAQLEWFKDALRRSTATWKLIASDMPVGLFISDALGSEAWANDDPGPPAGRELELAEILSFSRANNIRNMVWITADVHYAASHYYEPMNGAFSDFLPFWEFVSGPLHAGTFGPNRTDATFGPRVMWTSVPDGQTPNESPASYKQFFGVGRLSARTGVLTIEHYNLLGEKLWSIDLEPS